MNSGLSQQMLLHTNIMMGDGDDGDDGDDGADDGDDGFIPDGSKESTGRWTREEHHAFIKGLEMYGKGWKKIASLIKTRTVVQIRTHAQKYFLKLTKARQSGDANVSNDGKTAGTGGRKKKRRSVDRPVAVAPPLLPFVKLNNNGSGSDPLDIDDGLYNFLSPQLISHMEGGAGHGLDPQGSELLRPLQGQILTDKPEWFQKGYNVERLLKDAEELDWLQDTCTAVPTGASSPMGLMTAASSSNSSMANLSLLFSHPHLSLESQSQSQSRSQSQTGLSAWCVSGSGSSRGSSQNLHGNRSQEAGIKLGVGGYSNAAPHISYSGSGSNSLLDVTCSSQINNNNDNNDSSSNRHNWTRGGTETYHAPRTGDREPYLHVLPTHAQSQMGASSISSGSSMQSSSYTSSSSSSFATSPTSAHPLQRHQRDDFPHHSYPRPTALEQSKQQHVRLKQEQQQYSNNVPWVVKEKDVGVGANAFDDVSDFPSFHFDIATTHIKLEKNSSSAYQDNQASHSSYSQSHLLPDHGYRTSIKSELDYHNSIRPLHAHGRGGEHGLGGGGGGQELSVGTFEGTNSIPPDRRIIVGDGGHCLGLESMDPDPDHILFDDADLIDSSRALSGDQFRAYTPSGLGPRSVFDLSNSSEGEGEGEGAGADAISSSIAAYWHSDSLSASFNAPVQGPPLLQRAHSAPGLSSISQNHHLGIGIGIGIVGDDLESERDSFKSHGMQRGIMDLGFDDFMGHQDGGLVLGNRRPEMTGAKRSRVSLAAHSQDSEHQLMAEFFPNSDRLDIRLGQGLGQGQELVMEAGLGRLRSASTSSAPIAGGQHHSTDSNGPQAIKLIKESSAKSKKKEIKKDFKTTLKQEKEKEMGKDGDRDSNSFSKECLDSLACRGDRMVGTGIGGRKEGSPRYQHSSSSQSLPAKREPLAALYGGIGATLSLSGPISVPAPAHGVKVGLDSVYPCNLMDVSECRGALNNKDMRSLLIAANSKIGPGPGGPGMGVWMGSAADDDKRRALGLEQGQVQGQGQVQTVSTYQSHVFPPSHGLYPATHGLPLRSAFSFSQPGSSISLPDLELEVLNFRPSLEAGEKDEAVDFEVDADFSEDVTSGAVSITDTNIHAYHQQLDSKNKDVDDRYYHSHGPLGLDGSHISQSRSDQSIADQSIDIALDQIDEFDRFMDG